jgi:dTDP-4-dehydrorhamnose 3,5-epimerase
MQVERLDIEGLLVLTPDVFGDERGFFIETYQRKRYAEAGIPVEFVQDNLSFSKTKGTLRGLHYQAPPFGQGKLVQVITGKVFDAAVDIRFGSPTFGKYVGMELSAQNHKQFYIPPGFAHAFLTLEDNTLFSYKCTNVYSKEYDRGVLWNDPEIGIAWPITEGLMLSEKDQGQPLLRNIPREYNLIEML